MSGTSSIVGPDSAEWADALDRVRHYVYHRPEYVRLDADLLGGTAAAWIYREDDQLVLLPLVRRSLPGTPWTDVVSPYGYPGPVTGPGPATREYFQRCFTRLKHDLHDDKVVTGFLRLDPMSELPAEALEPAGEVVRHGSTVAIDLARPEEELLASFRRDHRRDIRRARDAGVVVGFDDWSRFEDFSSIYRENMSRVDAAEFYFFDDAYFHRLREALGPELHLAVADLDGEAVAAALAFEHGGIVQYHLSGTRTAALRLRPSKLMLLELALWARGRGNHAVHLGGGVGGADDTLFHYKAGFSSWHHAFSTVRIVTDEKAYVDLVAERNPGADAADRRGFFPAYRGGESAH